MILIFFVCISRILASNGSCYISNKISSHPAGQGIKNNTHSKSSIGFSGKNTGIGSWFKSNSAQDSTVGRSWCGYPYKDYTQGFAPDISVMTDGTNAVFGHPLYESSAKAYCGLEAIVTNPTNGRKVTIFITDAFDHRWVKSPGSIDLMSGVFTTLTSDGNPANNNVIWNKNEVINEVEWELTGNINPKYSFNGPGDP